MKHMAILGSTGSIGRSTLSVVESYPERFEVLTLAAGNNTELAYEQAVRWKPRVLSLAKEEDAASVRAKLRKAGLGEIEVVHGAAGTVRVATHPEVDFVVSAIVGVAGLEVTYQAVGAGKILGLPKKGLSFHLGRVDHGRGSPQRQAAAPHRQRAQRGASMPARRAH